MVDGERTREMGVAWKRVRVRVRVRLARCVTRHVAVAHAVKSRPGRGEAGGGEAEEGWGGVGGARSFV